MRRRELLKSVGGIGALGNDIAKNAVGRGCTAPSLERGFRPNRRREAAQYLYDLFNRIEELDVQPTELEPADNHVGEVEDLVATLSSDEKESLQQYIRKNIEISFNVNNEKSNNIHELQRYVGELSSRGSYTASLSATLSVPVCVPVTTLWGGTITKCYNKQFHAFDYEQTLQWYYDNESVSNARKDSTGNGSYYVLVGWNYKGDSDSWLRYHPDDYYVESYTQGEFDRIAFSDYVTAQKDYAELHLVGHRMGGGRTEDKNVID
mgnify:CR=1 FL=1